MLVTLSIAIPYTVMPNMIGFFLHQLKAGHDSGRSFHVVKFKITDKDLADGFLKIVL